MYEIEQLDDTLLFMRSFISDYIHMEPVVTIWGELPVNVYRAISNIEKGANFFRKLLFKERQYIITEDNINIFFYTIGLINFHHMSWGIYVNDGSSILAKKDIDTTIFLGSRISVRSFESFLERMKNQLILKGYKFVED